MRDHRDFAFFAYDQWADKGSGGLVLDVGARDDACKAMLEERGFVWEALDPVPQHPHVKVGRMEAMPLADNTYDLVWACHSFEHCERPVDALREMRRVLKPGGWIFLTLPCPCEHHILKSDDDHIFVLTPMQLLRLIHYTGFMQGGAFADTQPWHNGNTHTTIVGVGRK